MHLVKITPFIGFHYCKLYLSLFSKTTVLHDFVCGRCYSAREEAISTDGYIISFIASERVDIWYLIFFISVDPSEEPAYYTLIKTPMDFGKIKRKLEVSERVLLPLIFVETENYYNTKSLYISFFPSQKIHINPWKFHVFLILEWRLRNIFSVLWRYGAYKKELLCI